MLFPEEDKPIGRALFDMHGGRSKRFSVTFMNIGIRSKHFTINIDKPSDSDFASKVKDVIKKMIVYKPADRISMNEVVSRLSVIKDCLNESLWAMNEKSMWVRVGSAWKQLHDVPEVKLDMCFCGVSDGFIAVGGEWLGIRSSMCHHFSVQTCSWKRLPDMPTPRKGVAALAVGQTLMVLGGWDKNDLPVCERLLIADSIWISEAQMINPLYKPLVAEAAGKVYVAPRSSIPLGTKMQQYDLTTNGFSWAAQLPFHVQNTWEASLLASGDKLYLFGGKQGLASQYSPSANQWTQLSQPSARYDSGCCSVVHGGKFLLCGGKDCDNKSLVEAFDISTQSPKWKTTDIKLPFVFHWQCSCVLNIHVKYKSNT